LSDQTSAVAVRQPSMGDFTADALKQMVQEAAESGAKGTATGESMRDAMGGQRPKLDRVKVIHNGAAMFRRGEVKLEGMLGVIVAHTFHNTWFAKPFDEHEEGDRPPCSSPDAVSITVGAAEPQSPGGCAVCPRNRGARDTSARRAAFDRDRKECCSNYLSLAVLLPGEEIPVVVQFPQGSFRNWADFVQLIGSKHRCKPSEVLTKISLKNLRKDGGETSIGQFEMVGPLPRAKEGEAPKFGDLVAAQTEAYTAILRREANDETRSQESAGSASDAVREAKAAAEKAKQQSPGI
jgi:hypothetical protein